MATKKPSPVKKSKPAIAEDPTDAKARRLKQPAKLPSGWSIAKGASRLLWQHRKLFIGICLIYGLLNLLLVKGFAGTTDVGSLKNQFSAGHLGSLLSSLTIFVVLVGSSGGGSTNTAGVYQTFLVIFASLALVWAIRQVTLGNKFRVRDAYYRGMYPLIPLVLVLLVVGLQLVPLVLGGSAFSLVTSSGIAVNFIEKVIWAGIFIALAFVSFYLVCSSVFALYIVTLPDMTPMAALRSARGLVRTRRLIILRKILFLPLVLLVVAAVIMAPIIIFLAPLAQWVFFVLSMLALAATHAYMYSLYRELI